MMRALRRQLRSWRQEFLQTWRRLRSFHRVALGIILAFASMSAADRYLYRPLKTSIAEEQEKQKELEVPALVTKPEDDAEIQEAGLRIENAEQSVARQREELAKAVAKWPPFAKADQGTIVAKFNDLIARAGLRCLRFGEGPLPAQNEAAGKTRAAPRRRRDGRLPPSPMPRRMPKRTPRRTRRRPPRARSSRSSITACWPDRSRPSRGSCARRSNSSIRPRSRRSG